MGTSAQAIGTAGICVFLASSCMRGTTPEAARAQDRGCEVAVAQQLHQVVDVWETRYGVVVWCRSKGSHGGQGGDIQPEGQITVTVTPANGQSETLPRELQLAEMALKANLERTVENEGWAAVYPKRVLQVVR